MRQSLIEYSYALLLLLVVPAMASCSGGDAHRYTVAVSQCSQDIWRDKLNNELELEAYFHDNVELLMSTANDNDQRQIEQIDSFINRGVDLIIVSPNQLATITPAIDRAYDKGIPVIVFDRKTSSEKFTAYIGADNRDIGRVAGNYIAGRLGGKGRVLEIMGLKGSSPAIERHQGFVEALSAHPGITLVASLEGDWTRQSAVEAVKESGISPSDIDFVFGQNDRMALGAREVLGGENTRYCGVDGLAGEGGGIDAVLHGELEMSSIYPTHGDKVLQLALDILEGRPYPRETMLATAMVTGDNANVLLMESDEVKRQSKQIERLREQARGYLNVIATQRTFTVLAFATAALLLLLVAGIYMYFRQRARLHDERTRLGRERLEFYTRASHELRTPLTLIQGPLEQLSLSPELENAGEQTAKLFDIVRRNTDQLSGLVSKFLDPPGGAAPTTMPADVTLDVTPPATAAQTPDGPERATLLIVDDNTDILSYLSTVLQPRYELLTACDGKQGLDLAREQVPDLIVSDVMMPVMNGIELCSSLKSDIATSHIPVLLLTARAAEMQQVEGWQSGADAFVAKPFSTAVLLSQIAALLRNRVLITAHADAAPPTAAAPAAASAERSTATREQLFLNRVMDVVNERLGDSELSVEDIAAAVGLSRVQLYRKVKAVTGSTMNELLRRTRLEKARQLLLSHSDLTVSQVAYQVGFSSPSYFTRCFKEEYGELPNTLAD